jgi:hypothetical protein
VVPPISRVAFLWNPDNASNAIILSELREGAARPGVQLISVEASGSPSDKTSGS